MVEYLTGLSPSYLGIPGFYLVKHHLGGDRYRVLGDYENLKSGKSQLFQFLEDLESASRDSDSGSSSKRLYTRPEEWDFHHVVEGRHYANAMLSGELAEFYANRLPCVLVHGAEEHRLYSRLFAIKETKTFFQGHDFAGTTSERANKTLALAKTLEGRNEIKMRVQRMSHWYNEFYEGDWVLQLVSRNVFNEVLRRI